MSITYTDVVSFLTILALTMGIVLLYHLIAISLNVRRISKRFDRISNEIESVVMKPLTVADNAMEWLIGFLEGVKEGQESKKKGHKKAAEDFDVVDI